MRKTFGLLAGAIVLAFALWARPSVAFDATDGDAARGKHVYMSDGCYECHGTAAQGSIITGPALAPNPLSLETFSALVRHPRGVMPAYSSKVLSDEDIVDIYKFLALIPPSPEVGQVFR